MAKCITFLSALSALDLRSRLLLGAVAVSAYLLLSVFAQGPLAPPGAPAPTMKTLDQVEPRVPIGQADVPMTITSSGSYLLTSNLIVPGGTAIMINADDVTLDLNGFTIYAAFNGIAITSGRERGHIRNGTIRDAGDVGINGPQAKNFKLSNLRIFDCFNSVTLGDDAHLIDCVIDTSDEGAVGLESNALVRNCAFYRCGSAGEVSLSVSAGSQVRDCTFIDGNGQAILATDNCVVAGNLCRSNAFSQIQIAGSGNRVVDNQVLDGPGDGIRITGSGNEISGNIVRGNADNYDIAQSNKLDLVLCELPESIDWPASVKLAGTLTGITGSDGITVNASDVTIDLDGHRLVGVAGSLSGITVPSAADNIEVRNGTVRAWGHYGVDAALAGSSRFLNLRALANGFGTPFTYGLQAGPRSIVKGCTASGNASFGMAGGTASIIEGCVSATNGVTGIRAFSCTVTDCSSSENLGTGIHADASSVTDCTVLGNVGGGIRVSDNSTLNDNRIASNGSSFGIRATSSGNRIEDNQVIDQAIGLDLDAGDNHVAGNTVQGNTDNYDIAAGNRLNLLLSELPESIDWPASVTLAGTLTGTATSDGITVTADDVTIDLGGHVLQGAGGATTIDGIYATNVTNLVVRDGGVQGWGGVGILITDAGGGGLANVLEDIVTRNNGGAGIGCFTEDSIIRRCKTVNNGHAVDPGFGSGIRLGNRSLVVDCFSRDNQDTGIAAGVYSDVISCRSLSNGGSGIYGFASRIERCAARDNGGIGIDLAPSSSAVDCSATSNGNSGIRAQNRTVVRNCIVELNDTNGIEVIGDDVSVFNNSCREHSVGSGIRVSGQGGRIEGNSCTDNDIGLEILGSDILIIRNSASGNSTNFDFGTGINTAGPIVTSATIGGSSNPHANYEH